MGIGGRKRGLGDVIYTAWLSVRTERYGVSVSCLSLCCVWYVVCHNVACPMRHDEIHSALTSYGYITTPPCDPYGNGT